MAHLTIGPIEDKLKDRLEIAAQQIQRPVSWYVRVALDKQVAADLDLEPLGIQVVSVGMYAQSRAKAGQDGEKDNETNA